MEPLKNIRPQTQHLLEIYLKEYTSLKTEQDVRIAFRDHLVYATLTAMGAVAYFALSKDEGLYVLLIVPWVTIILGWTYLANDEKISGIRVYLERELDPKIRKVLEYDDPNPVLGWESAHRTGKHRRRRKWIQFFIDLLTFDASGCAALVLYVATSRGLTGWVCLIIGVETLLLLWLAYEFTLQARDDLPRPSSLF